MTSPKSCPYCGHALPPGARECPSCRFPDLDAPAERAKDPRKRIARPDPPRETCSHCGAAFPAGRPACPSCGSDADTGWKSGEEIDYAATEIPEDDPEAYREALLVDRPRDVSLWGARRVRNVLILCLLLAAMVVPLLLALCHL